MKGKKYRSHCLSSRSRPMRRPQGAKLTPEEDLSPDASPPRNPILRSAPSEEAKEIPPSSVLPKVEHAVPLASVHHAGDDLRPWVALRQRRLPHYFYRRLPNWFYPDRLKHEPYKPELYNKRRASTPEVVAASGPEEALEEEEDPENPWEPQWLTIH